VKFGSNQIRFQKLWQELPAMNLWDNKNYEASESHDFIERASCAARRRRMREIVLELISLNSRSQRAASALGLPENYTLSETASEAAKLLSKLQRTGSGFERWIIQNASLPSHKQFAVLRRIHLPRNMFTRRAVSATNNGDETCSIANQPAVAMAEFNLNLDGGIPWQEGKIQGISNYSRHQMLPMIAASAGDT
jgi:hypothetical protein